MADVPPHITVFLKIDDGSVREHENFRSSFCQCIICTKNANNAKQCTSHTKSWGSTKVGQSNVKVLKLKNKSSDKISATQHDGVRTTMKKKVHPKFFQNPFLGCPWVVWLGFRTWSAIGPFYLIKSLQFLEKITNLLLIATMKKA